MTKDRDFKKVVRAEAKRSGLTYQQARDAVEAGMPDEQQPVADPEFSPVELAVAKRAADLALRIADGKPIAASGDPAEELDNLRWAAGVVREAAAWPDVSTAESLPLEGTAGFGTASCPAERRLLDAIGNRRRVALAAAASCRSLLDLNPHDQVATTAMRLLLRIADGRRLA